MDLIERLRPKWRHPDPAVRAAAVGEVAEDRARLVAIARDDPDAGVRRAALELLDDVETLEHAAASDPDPTNRDLAADRLREQLVTVACSASDVAACERALARLSDPRSLASTASSAAHESIRRAALARVSGDRALRDVVRSATDLDIRRDAIERIADAAILRALADNHDAPKSLRQHARERLAEVSGGRVPIDPKEGRARQLELCTMVHALRAESDPMGAAARVAEAQHEWRDLARDVEPREDVAHRFAEACQAILAAAIVVDRRIVEVEHAKATAEAGIASRTALCERVEALGGADAPRELAEARSAWSRLPVLGGTAESELVRRFATAGRACEARHEVWLAGQSLHLRLEALAKEAEALAGSSPVPPAKAWKALERRWDALAAEGGDAEAGAVRPRLDVAERRLAQRREEDERQHQHEQKQNLTRLEALHARATEMLQADSMKPAAGRRHVEALQGALADLGPLPPSERRAAWLERLTEARNALRRKLGEVEETEEWRRWANAAAQEEIIKRVEALLESSDLTEGARVLGHLQEEWEKVATASPDKSRALWERFRTVRNELRKRCDAFMAENLVKKRALCEQVKGVGESTAWKDTTELLRRLQAEWKEIGPVPGRHTRTLWQEFRGPCDQFFARRKEQFDRADAERSGNAAKKTALCEQAEAIADSTDWETTANAFRLLQADWKRIGPAPHAENEALWQRFRGACVDPPTRISQTTCARITCSCWSDSSTSWNPSANTGCLSWMRLRRQSTGSS